MRVASLWVIQSVRGHWASVRCGPNLCESELSARAQTHLVVWTLPYISTHTSPLIPLSSYLSSHTSDHTLNHTIPQTKKVWLMLRISLKKPKMKNSNMWRQWRDGVTELHTDVPKKECSWPLSQRVFTVYCTPLYTVVHRGTLWRQAQSKGVVAGEPLTEPRGLLSGFEPLKGTAE